MKKWILQTLTQAQPNVVGSILPTPLAAGAPPTPAETIGTMLARVQSGQRLSEVAAEALVLAVTLGDQVLRGFCTDEVGGYKAGSSLPAFRMPEMYLSFNDINPLYVGWGGRPGVVIQHMEANPKQYTKMKVAMGQPLHSLESITVAPNALGVMRRKAADFPAAKAPLNPETPVYLYCDPGMHGRILWGARAELTRLLLAALERLAPVPTIKP